MNRPMIKDTLRELMRTKNRFISIFTIIALGVGFFAGLKATSSYMLRTADLYFSQSSLFDMEVLSTVGFDEDDLAAVEQSDRVEAVMPAYTLDALMDLDGTATVVKVHSLPAAGSTPAMNLPTLVQGRLPEKSGECVIDMHLRGEVGQSITLYADAKQDPIEDTLATDRYTIVGKVRTPYYITFERGSSTIGNGSINGFVMVPAEDFILDVYTNLYVQAAGAHALSAFSPDYTALTDTLTDTLEATGKKEIPIRYRKIMDEGNGKIADAEKELADGVEKQQRELADARKKIDDGNAELADAKITLAEKEQEYLDEIAKGEKELADAKVELDDGHAKYAEGRRSYLDGHRDFSQSKAEAEKQLTAAQAQVNTLKGSKPQLLQAMGAYQLLNQVAGLFADPAAYPSGAAGAATLQAMAAELDKIPPFAALSSGLQHLIPAVNAGVLAPHMVEGLLGGVAQAQAGLVQQAGGLDLAGLPDEAALDGLIAAGQAQIDSGYAALAAGYQQLQEGRQELAKAQRELEKGDKEYADGLQELEDGKLEGRQKIADAKVEIADAQKKLAEGEQEYADGKRDSDIEIADARVKIDDAKKELAELAVPKWYVQSRDSLPGYSGYEDNAQRIDAIASVFPLFFLLVAVLVCLTTMTRMVEEQRTKIGTLKGLGYGSLAITGGFLFYALTASLLGTVVGLVVGFQLFPRIIYNAYGIMYTLPPLLSPFKWDYAVVAVLVVLVLTTATVLLAGYKELVAVPATLMRPKSPKNGKRVMLERVPLLWRSLSFTQKVTMRNLLRYKKRMLMTVVGIAGCAALILTGFGIRDSISCIVSRQFGDIFLYDSVVVLETDLTTAAKEAVMQEALHSGYTEKNVLLLQQNYTAHFEEKEVEGYLFLPSDPAQLTDFVTLRHRKDDRPVVLTDEGIIISEKATELLGVSVGDVITLTNSDHEELTAPITDITENYAGHYFYLTPALFQRLTGKAPDYNAVLSTMTDEKVESQNAYAKELLQNDDVIMVSYTSTTRDTFTNMMKSLDYVVLVLILSAGALAFVVLYNLTNINIAERIREIATIKVLGFYDKEVSAYIYRENTLLTLMGIVAGLFLGILLHRFVINTAEVTMVMFGREVLPMSFVWAAGITVLFSVVVNLVMHFRLKKVSMVESLKSVE